MQKSSKKDHSMSMNRQAYERLHGMLAVGGNEAIAIANGTAKNKIFSYDLYCIYKNHMKDFIAWAKREHPEMRSLKKSIKKDANIWLHYRVKSEIPSWLTFNDIETITVMSNLYEIEQDPVFLKQIEALAHFKRLWELAPGETEGLMSRDNAYKWLSGSIGFNVDNINVVPPNEEQCERLISLVNSEVERLAQHKNIYQFTKSYGFLYVQAYEKLLCKTKVYEYEKKSVRYDVYCIHTKRFLDFVCEKHFDVCSLELAKQYINEWLQNQVDSKIPSWLILGDIESLCKLYAIDQYSDVFSPFRNVLCNYCGTQAEYKSINGHLSYSCPNCGAKVGIHRGTKLPLGTLAQENLREWRRAAHTSFDKLWKEDRGGFMSKDDAYRWLSKNMELPLDETNIAAFDEEQCQKLLNLVLEEVHRLVKLREQYKKSHQVLFTQACEKLQYSMGISESKEKTHKYEIYSFRAKLFLDYVKEIHPGVQSLEEAKNYMVRWLNNRAKSCAGLSKVPSWSIFLDIKTMCMLFNADLNSDSFKRFNVQCDYCGKVVRLHGEIFFCKRCNATANLYKETGGPVGRFATPSLYKLRKKAYSSFEQLTTSAPEWGEALMSINGARRWLSERMKLSLDEARVVAFDEEQCRKMIQIVDAEVAKRREQRLKQSIFPVDEPDN